MSRPSARTQSKQYRQEFWKNFQRGSHLFAVFTTSPSQKQRTTPKPQRLHRSIATIQSTSTLVSDQWRSVGPRVRKMPSSSSDIRLARMLYRQLHRSGRKVCLPITIVSTYHFLSMEWPAAPIGRQDIPMVVIVIVRLGFGCAMCKPIMS